MKYLIYILLLIPLILQSQVKYELLCNYELLNKSRNIAYSQIGVKESTGNNDGKQVESYLASVALKKGNPYCAAGQYWCFLRATEIMNIDKSEIPIKRTGSTILMFNDALKKGNKVKYTPKLDNLLFWLNLNGAGGHVERIFEVRKAGWVNCIGFNTGSGNAREGEGVFLKTRNIYHILSRMKIRGMIGFKGIK